MYSVYISYLRVYHNLSNKVKAYSEKMNRFLTNYEKLPKNKETGQTVYFGRFA